MIEKLQKFSRMLRLGAIAVLVIILGFGAYQLYDFYGDKVGFTPERTINTYFTALAEGDYAEVYRYTSKRNLTDIYGRPITRDEFLAQLEQVTGGKRFPFTQIETERLLERQGTYYYVVQLHSFVGGTEGESRLVVEVFREAGGWVLSYPFAIVL
jgi:hypothetical protein